MRILRAATLIALLAGPVYAQEARIPRYGETSEPKSDAEIQREKEADRAYKKSLGNIPDKGTPTDPWGNVRSDQPKAAAKDAKVHAKTGTAAK